jgi:FkbM family methyltransferase
VELVVDVGANRGLYAQELRAHGYRGRIVSFEPIPAAHAELVRRSARDERWEVRQLALSDAAGALTLGMTDNFASALPVAGRLASLFPEAVPDTETSVPAGRLDEQPLDLPHGDRTLVKLDVQGYELRVLAGASGMLPAVGMVETELSVAPLYEGQPVLGDMLRALQDAGFVLVALEPILRDWRTGEHLQFDGVFVRG